MNRNVVEMARIRLRPGAAEADLLAASNRFQDDFLTAQPGFLRRELLRVSERDYFDLVHWRSAEAAAAAMELAGQSPACRAYFAVMAEGTAEAGEGVTLCHSLATYG